MSSIENLPTPALLLDLDILDANLARMAAKTRALDVKLRPHIKTHKCTQIAERQVEHGASGLTASTLYEARVLADHGFHDVTWAFPLILSRLDEALALASRIKLGLVIDSRPALTALREQHGGTESVAVWIKVDCGYHRAGVDPSASDALELAKTIEAADRLSFAGILSHSGHAYDAADRVEMATIAEEERAVMAQLAERMRAAGIEVPDVSVGSTPSMSAVESLAGVTEARPGNYALYDHMQCMLGACEPRDCAVSVLASVVSSMPEHSVVDAGALAMSKDPGADGDSPAGMGPIYASGGDALLDPTMRLTSVSQEHGIVNIRLPVGHRLRIMPNHSCLTVACFDEYHVVQGGEVVDQWKIWRGR